MDAELKVVSLSRRKTVDHTIAATGARHNIHIVDVREQLGLLLKLNQYGSSTTPLVLNLPAEAKQEVSKRRRLVNSVKAKVHPPSNEEDHVLVRDDANRALIVRTINKVEPKSGVRTVTLFCDYWMVNKVGLQLIFKKGGEREICGGQVALEHEVRMLHRLNPNEWYSSSDEHSEHLFLHSDLGSWKGSGNRVQVKVAESQWSDSLAISSAGTSGVTTVKDFPVRRTEPVRLFELAVGVEAATEKFWRTKVVTFAPAFIVVNRSATSRLSVKQMGTGDERGSVLAPKTVRLLLSFTHAHTHSLSLSPPHLKQVLTKVAGAAVALARCVLQEGDGHWLPDRPLPLVNYIRPWPAGVLHAQAAQARGQQLL